MNALMIVGVVVLILGGFGVVGLSIEGMSYPHLFEYGWAERKRKRRIAMSFVIVLIGAAILMFGAFPKG